MDETAAQPGTDVKVGVASCDEWLTKYTACIDAHVPEGPRLDMKRSMSEHALEWRQAAATPEGFQALEKACKQMVIDTKKATEKFGCKW